MVGIHKRVHVGNNFEWTDEETVEVIFHDFGLMNEQRGMFVDAPCFRCCDHEWFVRIFPRGATDSQTLPGPETVTSVLFGVEEKTVYAEAEIEVDGMSFPSPRGRRNFGAGKGFLRLDLVREHVWKAAKNGNLHLRVTIHTSSQKRCRLDSYVSSKKKGTQGLQITFEEPTDTVFQHEDGSKSIAHASILAAESPFLYELLMSNEASDDAIPVHDVSRSSLQEVLKYMYTGEVPRLSDPATTLQVCNKIASLLWVEARC